MINAACDNANDDIFCVGMTEPLALAFFRRGGGRSGGCRGFCQLRITGVTLVIRKFLL